MNLDTQSIICFTVKNSKRVDLKNKVKKIVININLFQENIIGRSNSLFFEYTNFNPIFKQCGYDLFQEIMHHVRIL